MTTANTKTTKQYKISLTEKDVELLKTNGYKLEAEYNGDYVSKKTYILIKNLLEKLKRKTYFTGVSIN